MRPSVPRGLTDHVDSLPGRGPCLIGTHGVLQEHPDLKGAHPTHPGVDIVRLFVEAEFVSQEFLGPLLGLALLERRLIAKASERVVQLVLPIALCRDSEAQSPLSPADAGFVRIEAATGPGVAGPFAVPVVVVGGARIMVVVVHAIEPTARGPSLRPSLKRHEGLQREPQPLVIILWS